MLDTKEKEKIINKQQINKNDTASPQVQIALLTADIKKLTKHFGKNPKDLHSKRGFLQMVEKRKKLLKYLKRKDEKEYLRMLQVVKLKE
jgi:small subunit ribosomal protein S15